MTTTRRGFLAGAGAATLATASFTGVTTALNGFSAQAADTAGYKALVCIFLLGGLDTHDMLLPYDQTSYDQYADIRAPLMALYDAAPDGSPRARNRLLELTPDNAADFGARAFALPPEMPGIHGLFQAGNAALVSNVGPLIEPLTRTQWDDETAVTPKRLFSHNDQQSTWMASAPEGAQFGWGGRFVDAALASGANLTADFAAITSLGNDLFLTGETARPYQIGLDGASQTEVLKFFEQNRGSSAEAEALYQQLRAHWQAASFTGSNLLERDVAAAFAGALDANETYEAALNTLVPLSTAFPPSFLGQQLNAVANTIAVRNALLVNRQVFFVALGGFDTHSAQATDLPGLLSQLDGAVTAFHAAMQEMGLGSDVTVFTASDFGRTLAINGDGTDHGWGSHHLVIGDAVQGRRIIGAPPPPSFEHANDAGGGRLIPSVAVEQFAAPLGRWFGLSDDELAVALPGLSAFSNSDVDTLLA